VASDAVDSALVPVETEPSEVGFDLSGIFYSGSLRVKVFYAQYPSAAGFARRQP
jgi:hypothetical protein